MNFTNKIFSYYIHWKTPTEVFCLYIPRGLQWKKRKLKKTN